MKSVKNLIVPFIIFLCLLVISIGYFFADKFLSKKTIETTQGTITVLYLEPADVASLKVTDNISGYSSIVNCSNDSDKVICKFAGDDYDPAENYSQTKLLSYVNSLIYYYSDNRVSSDGNFSEYGLETPKFTITISLINGSVNKVFVGNNSPDGMNCYMRLEGSSDVYLVDVSKVAYAEKKAVDFYEAISLGIDYQDLSSVHFDRKTDGLYLDTSVKFINGKSEFTVYSPYKHDTSGYFGTMIDTLIESAFSDFIDIDKSELAKYGLDDPAYHFVFTLKNGKQTELFFSKITDTGYYGYIKGVNKYFVVSKYQINGLDLAETVLIDPYICYCYVKDVSKIIGTYGNKTFKFDLDVADNDTISSDNSTVLLDGRNAKILNSSGRSYCSILFESLACIKIGGVDLDERSVPSSEPQLTLTFIDKNYVSTVYTFYERNQDSYYVFKNGEYMHFYVYSSEIFNDGGADTYNYGYWKAYELLTVAISENMNGIYDL